jgi:hypothetical protein
MTSRPLSELMDVNAGTILVHVQWLVEMGLVPKGTD